MRELKFRAWDKKAKEWLNIETVMVYLDGLLAQNINMDIYQIDRNNVELMQYTGLLDKQGKEIYEGDIVKGHDSLEPVRIHGKVDFNDASFCIVSGIGSFYRWMDYDIEVIGNIYENSELLEK